jgi:hypothetical protein
MMPNIRSQNNHRILPLARLNVENCKVHYTHENFLSTFGSNPVY